MAANERYDRDEVLEVARQDWPGSFSAVGVHGHKEDPTDGTPWFLCPFHDDNDPSLHVHNIENGKWKCFACPEDNTGDFFDIVRRLHGTGKFPETLAKAAELLGVSPAKGRARSARTEPRQSQPGQSEQQSDTAWVAKRPKAGQPTPEEYTALEKKYKQRVANLQKNAKALEWIQENWGVDRETCAVAGIGYQVAYGNNPARIVFPIKDEDGVLLNMKKYCPKAAECGRRKVINEKKFGSPPLILGADLLANELNLPVLLVAGEKDWLIAFHHLANKYVVVTNTGGEACWQKEFNQHFQDRIVTICYDADEAGRAGAEKVARALAGVAAEVKVVVWPADFVAAHPKGDLADFYNVWVDPAKLQLSETDGDEIDNHGDMQELLYTAQPADYPPPSTPQAASKLLEAGKLDPESARTAGGASRWVEREETPPCYVKKYWKKGELRSETISDFVLDLLYNHIYDDGTWIREVRLVGRKTSPPFLMNPEQVTNPRDFRKAVAGMGSYTFDGDQKDLNEVWRIEFDRNPGKELRNRGCFGRVDGRYLLGNVMIDTDGQVLHADEDGVIRCSDGIGYKAISGYENFGGAFGGQVPKINTTALTKHCPRQEIFDDFLGFFNPQGTEDKNWYGAILLGFIATTIHSGAVYDVCGFFPILFLFGDQKSGKTSFVQLFLKFFGIDSKGDNWLQTTPFALNKSLECLSDLPYVLDEFTDRDRRAKIQPTVVNSIYNRQGHRKGTKAQGVRTIIPKGTLAICSRKRPDADDFVSRLVVIIFSMHKRTEACWRRLVDQQETFPQITISLVKKGPEELLELIDVCYHTLRDMDIDARKAMNYAIVAGGAIYMGAVPRRDMPEMLGWFARELTTQSYREEEEAVVGDFFEKLILIEDRGWLIEDKQWKHMRKWRGLEVLSFHFASVYQSLMRLARESMDVYPVKKNDLLDYLEDSGYLYTERDDCKIKRSWNTQYKDKVRPSIRLLVEKVPEKIRRFFIERDVIEEEEDGRYQ